MERQQLEAAAAARIASLPGAALVLSGPTILAATPEVCDLLGGRPPEGQRLADLVDPTHRGAVSRLVADGGREHVVTADVPPRYLELGAGAPDDDLVTVTIVDRTRERRLAAVVDSVADLTVAVDRDGLVTFESDRLVEMAHRLGQPELEIGASRAVGLIHPEDLPGVLEDMAWLLDHPGEQRSSVVRAVDPESGAGAWQTVELVGRSAVDRPELEGVVVRITFVDGAQSHPSVGRAPFESLAEIAPVGIVMADKDGTELYRNGTARELLGGDADPLARAGVVDWRDLADAEGRRVLGPLVADAVAGRRPPPTTCVLGSGPDAPHVRAEVRPRTADGQVVGVIATLLDVSPEAEARARAERLAQMLDAVPDLVAIWRPADGGHLYLNRAMREVLDRHRQAGGGGQLRDLLGADERERVVVEALDALERRETWTGELQVHVSPERTVPMWSVGVVQRDRRGEIEWAGVMGRDVSRLKEVESELRRLADHDDLTSLPNRKALLAALDEEVERLQDDPDGDGVAVLYCDLDGFKDINDSHGHAVGDEVLAILGQRLAGAVRDEDLPARVGGDEFVVLCRPVADAEALGAMAERIIEAMVTPVAVDAIEVRVGISIGIALARGGSSGLDADRILSVADSAMYRAKAVGGNRFRVVELD